MECIYGFMESILCTDFINENPQLHLQLSVWKPLNYSDMHSTDTFTAFLFPCAEMYRILNVVCQICHNVLLLSVAFIQACFSGVADSAILKMIKIPVTVSRWEDKMVLNILQLLVNNCLLYRVCLN